MLIQAKYSLEVSTLESEIGQRILFFLSCRVPTSAAAGIQLGAPAAGAVENLGEKISERQEDSAMKGRGRGRGVKKESK